MPPQKPYRRLTTDRLCIVPTYESASKVLQNQYLASCISLPSLEHATLPAHAAILDERPGALHWRGLAYEQALQAATTQQDCHLNEEPLLKVLRAHCSKQALLELKTAMTPSMLPQLELDAVPVQSSDGPSSSHPLDLGMMEVPVLLDAMQVMGWPCML